MKSVTTSLPPSDLEAEKSILSAVLLDNDAMFAVMESGLRVNDFYSRANGNIFKALRSLCDNGVEADNLTLTNALKKDKVFEESGGKEYLATLLVLLPTAAAVGKYCEIVKEESVRRQIIKTCVRGAEFCNDPGNDSKTSLDKIEGAIFSISQGAVKSGATHIADVVDSSFKGIERLYDNKKLMPGLTTGYKKIDRLIGGLQKTQLIIVAARPGMGKTSFCLNVATNAAREEGVSVLIFSLEMSNEELGVRMICSEGKVDSQKIKTGFWSDKDWDKLTHAASTLCDTNILIDDTPSLNILEVRSRTRQIKAKNPDLGLVIVDYLQLMKGTSRNVDRHLEVAEISRSLKALAKELHISVIALSQLSRKVEERGDKKPQLSDLRESGSIEQDADIVIFINRPEMYEQNNPELENIAEIDVAKNRSGPTGPVKLAFLKEYTRFENVAYDNNGPGEGPF